MYRKNTAGQYLGFGLNSATTGAALPGATVTAYRVIDNGSQGAATGTVADKGNGQYGFVPSQADTNGNQISFLFTAAGAVAVEKTIVTTAADPTDAVRFGLSNLDAPISGIVAAVWSYTTSMRLQNGVTAPTAWDCVTTARQQVLGGFLKQDDGSYDTYMPDGTTPIYTVAAGEYYDVWDFDLAGRTFTDTQAGGILQDRTGMKLGSDGLDLVVVEGEPGGQVRLNARQSLSIIAAAAGGRAGGLSSQQPVYNAAGVTANVPRITAVTDSAGNRSQVTLSPPA